MRNDNRKCFFILLVASVMMSLSCIAEATSFMLPDGLTIEAPKQASQAYHFKFSNSGISEKPATVGQTQILEDKTQGESLVLLTFNGNATDFLGGPKKSILSRIAIDPKTKQIQQVVQCSTSHSTESKARSKQLGCLFSDKKYCQRFATIGRDLTAKQKSQCLKFVNHLYDKVRELGKSSSLENELRALNNRRELPFEIPYNNSTEKLKVSEFYSPFVEMSKNSDSGQRDYALPMYYIAKQMELCDQYFETGLLEESQNHSMAAPVPSEDEPEQNR